MRNKLTSGLLAMVLGVGLVGCSGGDEPPPPRAVSPDPEHTKSPELESQPSSSSVNEQYESQPGTGTGESAVMPGAENIPQDVREGGEIPQ